MKKSELHAQICAGLTALYEKKNHDYGDSFAKSYAEWGLPMACIRLSDKLERLKAYAHNGHLHVNDESVEDTLLDLANYAIMTVIERTLTLTAQEEEPVYDRHCHNCKHKDLNVDQEPCDRCALGYGNGSAKLFWEEPDDESDAD